MIDCARLLTPTVKSVRSVDARLSALGWIVVRASRSTRKSCKRDYGKQRATHDWQVEERARVDALREVLLECDEEEGGEDATDSSTVHRQDTLAIGGRGVRSGGVGREEGERAR